MPLEIERKYIIKNFKLPRFHKMELIKQGYLWVTKNCELRVRSLCNVDGKQKFTTAIKTKTLRAEVRHEVENVVDPAMGQSLMKDSFSSLTKYRYTFKRFNTNDQQSTWEQFLTLINWDLLTWEVDYYPDLDLYVAEVELDSDSKEVWFPEDFKVVEWLRGDRLIKYSNRQLALDATHKERWSKDMVGKV